MYMRYQKWVNAHVPQQPEEEVYVAEDKYFLPTFDSGWTSKLKSKACLFEKHGAAKASFSHTHTEQFLITGHWTL